MDNTILIQSIINTYNKMNYAFFTNKDYNLNIFGVRAKTRLANQFDDLRGILYKDKGLYKLFSIRQSTDPGITGLKKPCRPEGCAILVPGQYRSSYKIGFHKGRLALIQIKPVSVYRDWNKDNILDMDPSSIMTGMFGINIHDPLTESEKVDGRSLGCQVTRIKMDHSDFMDICLDAHNKHGWSDIFTYTLFDEVDFDLTA
jgi:hypothetical protein